MKFRRRRQPESADEMFEELQRATRACAWLERALPWLWTGLALFFAVMVGTADDGPTRLMRAASAVGAVAVLLTLHLTNRSRQRARQQELEMALAIRSFQEATSDFAWGEALVVTLWSGHAPHSVAADFAKHPAAKQVVPAGKPPHWVGGP